jgi:hypothetical protein
MTTPSFQLLRLKTLGDVLDSCISAQTIRKSCWLYLQRDPESDGFSLSPPLYLTWVTAIASQLISYSLPFPPAQHSIQREPLTQARSCCSSVPSHTMASCIIQNKPRGSPDGLQGHLSPYIFDLISYFSFCSWCSRHIVLLVSRTTLGLFLPFGLRTGCSFFLELSTSRNSHSYFTHFRQVIGQCHLLNGGS